jgi:molybdate transport repressor ModE-like protein
MDLRRFAVAGLSFEHDDTTVASLASQYYSYFGHRENLALNTRFLATLRTVAEMGSIAAAARKLDLAANSVSDQIHALERELGVVLLSRHGRAMGLTAAGQAVADSAADILLRIEGLRQLAQLDQLRGRLHVGVISTVMVSILADTLRRMRQHYPNIEINIVPGTSRQLYRMIELGEIDCAVIVEPPFGVPKTCTWQIIKEYPLVLLGMSPMQTGSIETVIRSQPFIRVDRRAWTGKIVTAFLRDRGIEITEAFEMDGLEAIVMVVSQGLGVALLPDWGIEARPNVHLVKRDVRDPRYSRVTGLLGARGPRQRLTEALGLMLREAAE